MTADVDTVNAGATSFYAWAQEQGQTPVVDSGTPEPGDAVVFYPPGAVDANRYADHVGIVTAVHPDGTVDLVNGDFLGADGITVEYDPGVSLTPWAAGVWGAGEQWVLVAPPAGAQPAAPRTAVSGPHSAAAGTAVRLTAAAPSAPGAPAPRYAWTFGDGRDTDAATAAVDHVFPGPGRYSVTLTATAATGAAATGTFEVDVAASSGAAVSVPDTSVWYSARPIDQYLFQPAADGGLAAEVSDGVDWLRREPPGRPAPGTAVTALAYPDPRAADATVPHAYYRSADGTLAETARDGAGATWSTRDLAGSPAPGSALTAVATAAGPEVFFFDGSGRLTESAERGGTWSASEVGGPPVPAADRGALAAVPIGAGGDPDAVALFQRDRAGGLTVRQLIGGHWLSGHVPGALGAPSSGPAALATPGGGAAVFSTDAHGRLYEAVAGRTAAGLSGWRVHLLPGSPAAGGPLAATTFLPGTGAGGSGGSGGSGDTAPPLGQEVFYLGGDGVPAVTADDGSGWRTGTLPGSGGTVLAADAYPRAGLPQQLFLSGPDGPGSLTLDSTDAAGTTWSATPLPTRTTAYPDTVLLYAATPADEESALAAARSAGLPDGQVTTSFARAWAAALTGDYLVVAVGRPALDALYYNPCGWANPSVEDGGSTPFFLARGPLNAPPAADGFENSAAADDAQTPALAAGLAFYAVHGTLPPGATLPPAAAPARVCAGAAG